MVENQTKTTSLKTIIVNFMLKREQSKQKIGSSGIWSDKQIK